ncbi:hypothetical protein OIDMADRAFT_35956 [Oidiodendron maius Zn]|uniref:Uncharacterized protein n=1 Tax=Oidiodendron maius (strain Zn) TaxID=913774 RepID=A0A0C3GP42_OIDMZ|nr:hypothetical protein OIDMADRAFT_35956 [Oidiodendron maius Zn]
MATNLKTAIDNGFRAASKSKKRPCYHPQRSRSPRSPPPSFPASSSAEISMQGVSNQLLQRCLGGCIHATCAGTEVVAARGLVYIGASYGVASNTISLVSLGYDKLPYKHLITAAVQSLFLRLDELSLAVEFVKGFSGYLLVTRTGNAAVESKQWKCATPGA